MDGGPEKIEDPAELARVKKQARDVYVRAALATAAATLAALALPPW